MAADLVCTPLSLSSPLLVRHPIVDILYIYDLCITLDLSHMHRHYFFYSSCYCNEVFIWHRSVAIESINALLDITLQYSLLAVDYSLDVFILVLLDAWILSQQKCASHGQKLGHFVVEKVQFGTVLFIQSGRLFASIPFLQLFWLTNETFDLITNVCGS